MHAILRENKEEVETIISNITSNGLLVRNNRTINGTVSFFGRLDLEEDRSKVESGLENYYLEKSKVIIAIPAILRTESGKQMFIGTPDLQGKYRKYQDDTHGYETTTLAEYAFDGNKIDPAFIVGYITEINDFEVEYHENPYHISKTGGFVSEEFYDKSHFKRPLILLSKEEKFLQNIDNVSEDDIVKSINELTDELESKSLDGYGKKYLSCVLETLEQLLREVRLRKEKSLDNNGVKRR